MRVACCFIVLLGACGDAAVSVPTQSEHPAELAGTWLEQRLGKPESVAYVLKPDGHADQQQLDEGRVTWSEPGSWRVEDDSLVVVMPNTTTTAHYRLDRDVLSLGLFERLAGSTGIATFEADVLGWHPEPAPDVLSYLRPGDYVAHRVSLTIASDYSLSAILHSDDHSDCIILPFPRRGRCELDDAGLLACTVPADGRYSRPFAIRAPIDPETGLPQLEGEPSGYVSWRRTTP